VTAVVIATSNQGKLEELTTLLAPAGLEMQSLADYPEIVLPEEIGTTYLENATLKAEAVTSATGRPALGDDSGLEVAVLGGRPGLYSARFASERRPGESQDAANRRALLAELAESKAPPELWRAEFVCVLAFAQHGHATEHFFGRCAGLVLPRERGDAGFGYDPLLWVPELGKTMAELDEATKNRISHRGQAAQEFLRRFSRA
jgi:XTP/dITP diphosphohydrolase